MSSQITPPMVLIAGAGIGGLFLGLLLERQNVPYMIYERAPEIRCLGSAMGFGANILPVFEQLGILEEMLAISQPAKALDMLDTEFKFMSGIDFSNYKELTGYPTIMFTRPEFHALLYSHIPKEKVVFSKRVLSLEQNEIGVMLRMADGSTYHGDIVVGADGAYSGVRQGLYKHLDRKGFLPASDREELKMGHLCMVGTTDSLDPEKFPTVTNGTAHFQRIINSGAPFTWHTVNMRENRLCWGVTMQLDSSRASKDTRFRNSEWTSDADGSIMGKVFTSKSPGGGTVQDLIDSTPKEKISNVFLEEKLFETWYHGRTVLIGD
ncbi:hypothetical protein BX616_006890, partial [Lobosporangium transversale]